MIKFKPGDVIQYQCPQYRPSSGIVAFHDEKGVWVGAFNHNTGHGWATAVPEALITVDPRPIPHPNADEVLASYVAWRLTQ